MGVDVLGVDVMGVDVLGVVVMALICSEQDSVHLLRISFLQQFPRPVLDS